MTARLYEIFNGFQTGVLDPIFMMRTETGAYNNSLAEGRNIQLLNSGGWMRRGGTNLLATLSGATRIESFIFDTDEVYIVAFYASNVRIYSVAGSVLATLSGPWSAAEVWELAVTQLYDTMIITHQAWEPRVVKRTGVSSFSISTFAFDVDIIDEKVYQPYYKYAAAAVTIAASATSGSGVTITAAGGSPFTSDWVGDIIRWFDTEIEITAYSSGTSVTGTIRGTLEGSYLDDPFRTTDGSGTVEVTHALHGFANSASVTISGATAVGGITAAQLTGAFTITVVDDNHYTIATGGTATSSSDGGGPSCKFTGANLPTRRWDQPAFSVVNGYPRCCLFYESRLWFASTPQDPSALWSSKINQFFNFDVGDALPNDSIQTTVGTEQQVAEILHLNAEKDFSVFTMTGEYYAPKPQDSTLTPETFRLIKQTPYGASSARPVNFDGATLFVQEGTSNVREFLYTDLNQAYTASSVSFLSSHLLSNPVQIGAIHGTDLRPEQYAMFVNDDGTIAVFLSSRAEKLNGWTWFDTYHPSGTAAFKSLCVIGRTVYVVALRNSTYYLEELEADDTQMLDCATNYTASPATTSWVVDSLYFSTTVDVMSGDVYLGSYAVDGSGNLELDFAVTDIHVGWGATMEVDTVPPRVELPTGTRVGIVRRIAESTVHFHQTMNCTVKDKPLIVRNVTDDLSQDPTPITGKRKFSHLGWSKDPYVSFTQTAPQKCRVLGIVQKVMVT